MKYVNNFLIVENNSRFKIKVNYVKDYVNDITGYKNMFLAVKPNSKETISVTGLRLINKKTFVSLTDSWSCLDTEEKVYCIQVYIEQNTFSTQEIDILKVTRETIIESEELIQSKAPLLALLIIVLRAYENMYKQTGNVEYSCSFNSQRDLKQADAIKSDKTQIATNSKFEGDKLIKKSMSYKDQVIERISSENSAQIILNEDYQQETVQATLNELKRISNVLSAFGMSITYNIYDSEMKLLHGVDRRQSGVN